MRKCLDTNLPTSQLCIGVTGEGVAREGRTAPDETIRGDTLMKA